MNLPVTAVLMGGVSSEHAVSLRSGRCVLEALAEAGCPQAVPVVIDPAGRWAVGGEGPVLPEEGLAALRRRGVGCCFLALHGRGGEDGVLQGFLETAGLPYTGSGVAASAVAMSKALTRTLLAAHGLPLAPGFAAEPRPAAPLAARAARELGFPCFLKEELSGSSLGVHRVAGGEELERLLAAFPPGQLAVVERAVAGVEASAGVVGNWGRGRGPLQALPPVEIRPKANTFFDYQAKYQPGASEEICPPAGLDRGTVARLEELALAVHRALGCDGLSRTDFIVGPEGPVILECNTLPGFTPESLLPREARAAGITFPELVGRLVGLALAAAGRP